MPSSSDFEQRSVLQRLNANLMRNLPRGGKEVLTALCECAWSDGRSLSAQDIRRLAGSHFHQTEEDLTAGLRVFMSRVRSALKEYFKNGAGATEEWLLTIPVGRSANHSAEYGAYVARWVKRRSGEGAPRSGIVLIETKVSLRIVATGDAAIRYKHRIQNGTGQDLTGRDAQFWFEHPQPKEPVLLGGFGKIETRMDVELVRDYPNSKHLYCHFPDPIHPGCEAEYWYEIQAKRAFRKHHYWDLKLPSETQAEIEVNHDLPDKELIRVDVDFRSPTASIVQQNYPCTVLSRARPMHFRLRVATEREMAITARWFYK